MLAESSTYSKCEYHILSLPASISKPHYSRTDPGHALDRKAQIHGEQFSLRTLLQDPSVVSLRALRNFVQRNAPNPTPRAPPANPALEGFYDLAKNLLDDVAEKSSLSLDKSIVGVEEEKEVETTPKDEIVAKPAKYALHQHLPTGDYFTSAAALSSSEIASMKKGAPDYRFNHRGVILI